MKITLNNRIENFDSESLSIAEIIIQKNFTFKLLVTKINGELVKKDKRETAMVKDGDNVLILHLISGG
ncbi:MAG: sulfur carrier protein ThiS [Bacteroidales bacterium]|jgi:thiamine biosynthesis protein ThiS|nr:sulfur carrier protein ThiS [Bacteroidales bacterium]